jgi:uncharacterized protein (TIGR02271 family)
MVSEGIARNRIEVQGRGSVAPSESAGGIEEEDRGFMERAREFFAHLFGDDEEHREHAGHYSEAVRRGGAVVSVDVEDEAESVFARSVLESEGAVDIDERVTTWKAGGYTGFEAGAAPYSMEEAERERGAIPVVEEDLVVGKREVSTGRVRVYSRPTSKPVSTTVSLSEEHATIERRPVDREATARDLEGGTIEVRESAEEAVVGKKSRVVEEVVVGKERSERTETINETLRGTEVEVDRSDKADGSGIAAGTPPVKAP